MRSKCRTYNHIIRDLVDIARESHFILLLEAVETGDNSLWRTPRRGAILETTHQDIVEKVIELVNRWCKKEVAKGSEAGLPMRQVYTQVKSACVNLTLCLCKSHTFSFG